MTQDTPLTADELKAITGKARAASQTAVTDDTTTATPEGRSFERQVVPLVQQLRDKVKTGPQGSIWCDDARRLMLWAAMTIEAADAALLENYKHNVRANLDPTA